MIVTLAIKVHDNEIWFPRKKEKCISYGVLHLDNVILVSLTSHEAFFLGLIL